MKGRGRQEGLGRFSMIIAEPVRVGHGPLAVSQVLGNRLRLRVVLERPAP